MEQCFYIDVVPSWMWSTKRKNTPKLPLLLWADIPQKHRISTRIQEFESQCVAATRNNYGLPRGKYARCGAIAHENGLCAVHLKVRSIVGTTSFDKVIT